MNYKLQRISYCFDDQCEQYIVISEGNNNVVATVFRDVKSRHFYKVAFVTQSFIETARILDFLKEYEND